MELNPQFRRRKERKEPDFQHVELKQLFDFLVETYKYSTQDIVEYVADKTGIDSFVISGWLEDDKNFSTNQVSRKRILGVLENLHKTLAALTNLRGGDPPKSFLSLVKTKEPTAITAQESSPEKALAKKHRELNDYEKDLLYYLKNTFFHREFHIDQVGFPLKKDGRREMYRNLDFLKTKGYIKGPFQKAGSSRLFYRVIE